MNYGSCVFLGSTPSAVPLTEHRTPCLSASSLLRRSLGIPSGPAGLDASKGNEAIRRSSETQLTRCQVGCIPRWLGRHVNLVPPSFRKSSNQEYSRNIPRILLRIYSILYSRWGCWKLWVRTLLVFQDSVFRSPKRCRFDSHIDCCKWGVKSITRAEVLCKHKRIQVSVWESAVASLSSLLKVRFCCSGT